MGEINPDDYHLNVSVKGFTNDYLKLDLDLNKIKICLGDQHEPLEPPNDNEFLIPRRINFIKDVIDMQKQ